MGELRQHHPSLKISQIKELAKGGLLVVGDSPQDAVIVQNESKMKAVLGKNVRISSPKAYQISQKQNKCLDVKRVSTDITEDDFKEFLDLNKISYAKAESLKAKKKAGFYPFFNSNLATLQKLRFYFHKILCVMLLELRTRRKNFVSPFRFGSASTANVSDIWRKTVSPSKNVSSVVRTIHTKDAQKKAKQPKCSNCSGPHVASYKGCLEYKKQAFRQHVVNNQKTYAAAVRQKSHPQPKTQQTFQFTVEQLTKFLANVTIQIARPQVCYPNPKQDKPCLI